MTAGHFTEENIELPVGPVSLIIPEGVHAPPASSVELARHMDVHPGENVLDLGCGGGLFSIAAAKARAAQVVATDIVPTAVESALKNALINNVPDTVSGRVGSWYEPLDSSFKKHFDMIIANPPQTPGLRPFGPHYGGRKGLDHLSIVIQHAPRYLRKNTGRLLLLLISLADVQTALHDLKQRFKKVSIIDKTNRFFTPHEYDRYDTGLFSYFLSLKEQGLSDFQESAAGTYVFQNIFVRAARPLQT